MRVYTGGTFDLFHYGHVLFLERCCYIARGESGGKLFVGLNKDEFIEEFKGKPPIMTYDEREIMIKAFLSNFKIDAEVIPNSGGKDSKPAIISCMPDIIVIGSDWARKDYYKQMGFTQDWLDKMGIDLCYVPYTKGISTTEIKKRIKNRGA